LLNFRDTVTGKVRIKQGTVMDSRDNAARPWLRVRRIRHDSGAGRRCKQQAGQRRRDLFDRAGAVPGKKAAQ
jgi:hypothetical protein